MTDAVEGLAEKSPVIKPALDLDLKPATEIVESPAPVMQAQQAVPAAESAASVSSLAATAASAADLFR